MHGDEDPLAQLPQDDEFYEAVDASIYRAFEKAMVPIEQRLTRQTAHECAKWAQTSTATAPVPNALAHPPDDQPFPAKRPERMGKFTVPF
ncbi:hypothetical protein NDU88_005183 [Pleurodeles waltl]|uniref:Uncharacterized protein n=1 Tax=Pleurodeles waltl TaxID=8319 RepID=A0AAV7SKY8_PLEWA|nr:hypothetical protein NDU88_005183 [Pleurodeles waltl]